MSTNDKPRPRPNPIFHVVRSPPSKETAGCIHMGFSRRQGKRPELLDPLQLEQEHFSHEDEQGTCSGDGPPQTRGAEGILAGEKTDSRRLAQPHASWNKRMRDMDDTQPATLQAG